MTRAAAQGERRGAGGLQTGTGPRGTWERMGGCGSGERARSREAGSGVHRGLSKREQWGAGARGAREWPLRLPRKLLPADLGPPAEGLPESALAPGTGGLQRQTSVVTVLEAGRTKVRVPAGPAPRCGLSARLRGSQPVLVTGRSGNRGDLARVSSAKGTSLVPRLRLQTPLTWGVRASTPESRERTQTLTYGMYLVTES